jgi:Putative Actinobacterial Holin-X, holin superfamily III
MDNRAQRSAEPSLAALLGGIMNDAKDLLIQELMLAKLEVQDELRQIKTAALYLGIGIGVATVGGMLLSVMLVHVLAAYTDMPLWGCYGIVGSVLAVLGGVLLVSGTHKAGAIDVVPQTVETMKENAQWLTEQMTSDTISRTPVRQ